ncbi:protein-glutamate methylesterase CheB [Sphingobacterium spiritivorum ATCC 33300]|uniref:protein-glutamate methylesterase n=1 Tax=Sphingobacterium spiritivorum ATCC 33300 TaxID=525372 RepID=C2FZA9_SPHSI|nr:chemotaxis protein CheB [Sphingobacterium spiritivorum]EEI91718.1 protein-glutamate methylesterase CheB [Sphingobacterium spiritivorum ATCC 33300]
MQNNETNIESSLSKKCKIEVKIAEDKEKIQTGVAYFAPPGYHLLVEPDYTFSLDSSEPVQFCRPSIDVTMESAADVYQSGTCGFCFQEPIRMVQTD